MTDETLEHFVDADEAAMEIADRLPSTVEEVHRYELTGTSSIFGVPGSRLPVAWDCWRRSRVAGIRSERCGW